MMPPLSGRRGHSMRDMMIFIEEFIADP